MKLTTLAMLGGLAASGILGCEARVYAPAPVAAVEVGYDAPVVYDDFYIGGHYDGPFWLWHDREGHFFRESREIHERRFAEHGRAGEHRAVVHEEHPDEHHDDHH